MVPKESTEVEVSVREEPDFPSPERDEERSYSLEPFIVVAKHKRFIGYFTVAVAVITAIVSLLLPVKFTAETKILPPQQNQSIASSMLSQLSPLLPLLGGANGGALGLRNPNDMYIAMLRSRTVSDAIVDRFGLKERYGQKYQMEARKELATRTDIISGRDSIITIDVEDKDPKVAAAIANAYVEELDKLTRELAVTDAGKRRLFFEREVKSANDELANAEEAMKQTQEKTGLIQLDSQSKVMLEAYAILRGQVTAMEVQVQSMKTFATPDNPDLIRAEQQLNALKAQLSRYEQGAGGTPIGDVALEKVPARLLEYVRRYREVRYRETVLELLLKQYEIARIDEARDASIIQVLDKAEPPEKRSWPKRTVMVIAATLLALFLAIGIAFLREKAAALRANHDFMAQAQLLRHYLRGW